MDEKVLMEPQLDRGKLLWMRGIVASFGFVILFFFLSPVFFFGILFAAVLSGFGAFGGILSAIIGLVIFLIIAALPGFLYAKLWVDRLIYQVTNEGVFIKEGILFKKWKTIPFDKITDIVISQGPLETIFGLKSIRIQTAGMGYGVPEGTLHGIANAEETRNKIMEIRNRFMGKSVKYGE